MGLNGLTGVCLFGERGDLVLIPRYVLCILSISFSLCNLVTSSPKCVYGNEMMLVNESE